MNIKIVGSSSVAALMVAGLLALAGCTETTSVTSSPSGTSGTGLPAPTTPPVPGGSVAVNGVKVQLLVSTPQIPSAGTTTVDLTAVVLDQTGQALASRAVTFSTGTDPSAFVSTISGGGTTDSNGQVTAKLNLGAVKSNRTITITVTDTDSTASSSNVVGVIGTTLTISGSTSLAFGASTTLTFALKDSAGTPIPSSAMTFTSQAGNAIAPSSTVTDAAGQITAVVTATQTAVFDVLTATGGGTSKTQSLAISSSSFAFTTPAPSVDIPLGVSTPVNVNWTSGGVGQNGQQVSFSTSRGTITATSIVNAAGDTPGVAIISNASAGPAIITAQGQGNPGPAATLNINFVATTATSVSVQAVPGTVGFTTNAPGQTNNVSTITVTVRDGGNNLVKNASISFSLTDTTGGFLAANTAITDVTGSASVNYTAGSVSSAQNGVTITATVDKVNGVAIPVLTGTASLTVAGQALFVRLGTDNFVIPLPAPDPDLQKKWSALVTDAAGNAVVGAQVRFTLVPRRYYKGRFIFDDTAGAWIQTRDGVTLNTATLCASEDDGFTTPANANNGILDPGEDDVANGRNGNGRLDPGNVASVNATGTTDANGIAIATLTYAKSYAAWVDVELQARAGVVGNDPPTIATFRLVGLASDYTTKSVPPPGVFSPFGTALVCTNPN